MADNRKIKQKQYGLMDAAGGAVKGTVDAARDVTGGAVSGVGSVLDSGGGKMVGGLAGAGTALATLGAPAAGIGASAGAAGGAALGATIGSIIPGAGTLIGGGIGGLAGGILGGVGAAGLVAKGGQALGSSLTQATGEGLKGVGNAIKAHKEFSRGSVMQKEFDEDEQNPKIGPDLGDAMEVGGDASMGLTGGAKSSLLGKAGAGTAAKAGMASKLAGGAGPQVAALALTAPVDKAKEIIGDGISEAENYRPTVRNSFVKQKNHSDQDFQDMSNTIGEGVEKAGKTVGNGIGGATGALAGGAGGAVVGGLAGKAAVKASNKMLGTSLKGGGKYGMAAGLIGGSILGGQKGSSLFSDKTGSVLSRKYFSGNSKGPEIDQMSYDKVSKGIQNFQTLKDNKVPANSKMIEADLERASAMFSETGSVLRTYAATGELGKAAKGLWNVAKQHKGTVAEGLGAGVLMGGTGYLANKAINKDQDARENGEKPSGMSAGKKIALGAGGAILGAMALKKGANYGLLGKGAARGTTVNKAINRGASATMTGVGFGAGMAALPLMTQASQEQQMQGDTGGGTEKKGMSTGKKVLLGGALAAGTALGGYKLAKAGKLGGKLEASAGKLSGKIEKTKIDTLNKLDKTGEAAKAREAYKAEQAAKSAAGPEFKNPTWKENKGEFLLDKGTAFMGGGTQRTQRLAKQLGEQDSKYLQKTGEFLQNHKKTALVAAAPLGYAATMGTWQAGEDMVSKPLKKIDPDAYRNEEEQ